MVKEIKQTIAVMQPYFIPSTGYFRLLSRADTFVIYDCVQYQRRGWLHRNKLLNHKNKPQWLTLPLEKGLFVVRIFGTISYLNAASI